MAKDKNILKKPVDEIRKAILNFLNEKRQKTRSLKSIGSRPSELKSELKKRGLTENEIILNLDFLIKNRWVDERREKYFIPGKRIQGEKLSYELSNLGISYFENGSQFHSAGQFSGINFQNIQDSVIVVGAGNAVQVGFRNLYDELDALKLKVLLSNLSEVDKLNHIADIETIKTQLIKSNPDKGILQKAWEGLQTLAALVGAIENFNKVKDFILPLIK